MKFSIKLFSDWDDTTTIHSIYKRSIPSNTHFHTAANHYIIVLDFKQEIPVFDRFTKVSKEFELPELENFTAKDKIEFYVIGASVSVDAAYRLSREGKSDYKHIPQNDYKAVKSLEEILVLKSNQFSRIDSTNVEIDKSYTTNPC